LTLPPPQKFRLRQRLRGEIENANRRRAQRGLEPLVLAELIRQAEDRQAEAADARDEPDSAMDAEMSGGEMAGEMYAEMNAEMNGETDSPMEPGVAKESTVNRPRPPRRKFPGATPVKVDDATIESTIRDAYLRTLCRYPDVEEMAASIDYVRQSDDAAAGVHAVMWALLNTKEFVLTH